MIRTGFRAKRQVTCSANCRLHHLNEAIIIRN